MPMVHMSKIPKESKPNGPNIHISSPLRQTACRNQGLTWSEPEYAAELTDPICEGSMSKVEYSYYSIYVCNLSEVLTRIF